MVNERMTKERCSRQNVFISRQNYTLTPPFLVLRRKGIQYYVVNKPDRRGDVSRYLESVPPRRIHWPLTANCTYHSQQHSTTMTMTTTWPWYYHEAISLPSPSRRRRPRRKGRWFPTSPSKSTTWAIHMGLGRRATRTTPTSWNVGAVAAAAAAAAAAPTVKEKE